MVASAPWSRWKREQRRDVKVGDHVTVHDQKGLVYIGEVGGEANGACRVEWFGSTA